MPSRLLEQVAELGHKSLAGAGFAAPPFDGIVRFSRFMSLTTRTARRRP